MVLISKVKVLRKMVDFWPINIYSVIYKIVIKVLASHLKLVLPSLISDTQSAFVPGRLIIDNVIVAFELMHSLGEKRNGRKGWMALKLVMSKAYGRVEWPFLVGMTQRLGFPELWINVVMDYVSTSSLSFIINEPHGRFRPTRGLRQGCPLSPYLFLICAERLSGLLNEADRDSHLGVLLYQVRSHLFFADNSLLFCRPTLEECFQVRAIHKYA